MKISPRDIGIDDFIRYFNGSFIIDPYTKLPAQIMRVDRDPNSIDFLRPSIVVESYAGDSPDKLKVTSNVYEGEEKTAPFYDLSLYSKHNLGYKTLAQGRILLYMTLLPQAISGTRGIIRDRLRLQREIVNSNLWNGEFVEDYTSYRGAMAYMTMTNVGMPVKEAIGLMLGGAIPTAVINNDIALAHSTDDDSSYYPIRILYKELEAGKISDQGDIRLNEDMIPVISEVFG